MTNQQILTKAIQKAIEGGWDAPFASIETFLNWGGKLEQFIFNHDFAKALWGKIRVDVDGVYIGTAPGFKQYVEPWKIHLQQMVTAEDPIKYLGEHLDG